MPDTMKSLRYILFALSVVLLASCNDQLRETEGFDPEADYALELSVSCMSADTKAVEGPELWDGIEKYNENKVGRVDWYLFKSATDTDDALAHGQVTATQEEGQTTATVVEALEMSQIMATAGTNTFYVYTIANLPASVEHDAMGTTLAALKAVEVAAGFNNASFTAQDSFVMAGGDSVTLETKGLTPVTCPLTRLASKVSLKMNVSPVVYEVKVTPTGGREYVQTWYPKLDDIQVYLSYANQKTTVEATPVSYNSNFFTYYRTGFVPEYAYTGSTGDPSATVPSPTEVVPTWTNKEWKWNLSGSPFYSYPMEWTTESPQAPFLKIILKWTHYPEPFVGYSEDGKDIIVEHNNYGKNYGTAVNPDTHEFYYKVPLPGNVLYSNDWYELTFNVDILGSTTDELPVELAGQYSVVDWSDPHVDAGGNLIQGRYLTTASEDYYMYGDNQIEIPVTSSHILTTGVDGVITKREIQYNGSWIDATSTTATGSSIYQLNTLRNRTTLDVTRPAGGDGRSAISFSNTLRTTINDQLDLYPMRFTLLLQHSDGQGPSKQIVVYQYPSIYVESRTGGNAMVDGYYGNVNGYRRNRYYSNWSENNYANYHLGTLQNDASGNTEQGIYMPYGRITNRKTGGTTPDSSYNLTILTVSSFAGSPEYTIADSRNGQPSSHTRSYILADPRQPSGYSTANYSSSGNLNQRPLVPYYNGSQNVEWGDNAAKIMVGNRTTPNYIAPKIIVASRWGRMVSGSGDAQNGYYALERRCATYQEAGYPAGRWRLPTEAEVNFIANLQAKGLIGRLYEGNGWVAGGFGVQISGNNVSIIQNGNTVRCVYDAWYWGDQPVDGAELTYTIGVE